MVRDALVYILQQHLLSLSNCCLLLETAQACSVEALGNSASQLLCSNFMQVLQCHGSSFGDLSRETLMLVLGSNNIKVQKASQSI